MSFLETILKPKKQKQLGVCIPIHAKIELGNGKINKTNCDSNSKEAVSVPAEFEVEGIYEIKKTVMVTGRVSYGCLSTKSKLISCDSQIELKELLKHGKIIDKLKNGEMGSFVIVPEFNLRIKTGDILEFE